MTGLQKTKTYDPHLLYHAINITVELQYKVQMQRVYNILEAVEKRNEKASDKLTPEDVLNILSKLGNSLEDTIMSDDNVSGTNLQAKIKEILRLLGCVLTDEELNKILKGELKIEDALSKTARVAWLMVFEIDERGRYYPDKEIVEQMLFCTQCIAIENVEMRIQRNLENRKIQLDRDRMRGVGVLARSDNFKTMSVAEKEKNDPIMLDKKRAKLKLYVAHMQGYDRDRDRDGGRGIDMTTGEIIDFGDIYIADKSHGSIIHDIGNDGIDIADIK